MQSFVGRMTDTNRNAIGGGQEWRGTLDFAGEVPRGRRLLPSPAPACRAYPLRWRPSCATLNRMVQHSPVDRTFAALSDPTRRGILERLGRGNATISELAEPYGISLTGLKKHVRVLEDAELVVTKKVGRTRTCRLGPRRLDEIEEWISMYRRMLDERLDRFGELLERRKGVPR